MTPSLRASRFANLTPEDLARLSERGDTVVYEPTHDTIFEPWPAQKVRKVVRLIIGVSKACESEDEARTKLRALGGDVAEFESKYQVMFKRLTEPNVARNPKHVEIVLNMISIRERLEKGELDEMTAQRLVGEQTLANLMAQAQGPQTHD